VLWSVKWRESATQRVAGSENNVSRSCFFVVVGVVVHVFSTDVATSLYFVVGHAVALSVEALRYKPEGRGFDFRRCLLEFFIDIILPATLWPWGRLSL